MSDEHGEPFHQSISTTEKRYQETWSLVCWSIVAGHLEVPFHEQNIAESHPLLLCRLCIYSLSYNENRFFPRNSMAPHLKTLPVSKHLIKYLNSAQKISIWFTYFSRCGKNYFVIQCCHK